MKRRRVGQRTRTSVSHRGDGVDREQEGVGDVPPGLGAVEQASHPQIENHAQAREEEGDARGGVAGLP